MTDRLDEITAWHESGHAFAAVWLGATVESVSVNPDVGDGPQCFGDIIVRWNRDHLTDREIAEKSVMVALGGPVAEMIHRSAPMHPATESEWSQDWSFAWSAADFIAGRKQRMEHLQQTARQLYHVFSQDHHWAAIGAIVDHLLAHETLGGDTVHEIVSEWT